MIKEIKSKRFEKKRARALVVLILAFAIHFQISPYVAFARESGGGNLAKFDSGKFALNVGISVASTVAFAYVGNSLGSLLGSGKNAATQSTPLLAQMGNGYSTYFAASQVGGAVGNAGAYYKWSPRTTYAIQTIATAATAGALNPEISLGSTYDSLVTESLSQQGVSTLAHNSSTMLKGATVGALGGAAQSYVVGAIDGDRINEGKNPGIGAQIAGMTAGMAATSFGRSLFDPATYKHKTDVYVEQVPNSDEAFGRLENQRFGNNPLEGEGVLATNEMTGEVCRIPAGSEMPSDYRMIGSGEKLYLTVDKVSTDGNISYGEKVYTKSYFSDSKVMDLSHPAARGDILPSSRFYSRGGGIIKIVNTQAQVGAGEIVGRLAKATVVDTVHQYPAIASSYVGMVATNELDEDDQDDWRPLVNGLSNAVVGSTLTNLRDFYGLTPTLHVGSDSDIIDARLMRKATLYAYGHEQRMTEFNESANRFTVQAEKDINEARNENYNDGREFLVAKEGILKELGENLASLGHTKESFYLGRIEEAEQLSKDSSELAMKSWEADPYFDKLSQDKKNKIPEVSRIDTFAAKSTEKGEGLAPESFSAPQLMRNVASRKEGTRLEYNMAHASDTNKAFKIAGITKKSDMFLSRTWNNVRFGVFNSVIGDGMAVVSNKYNKHDGDSTKQILSSVAGNMAAAVVRGVAWHSGWKKADGDWHQRWDYVEPRSYEDRYASVFWKDPETKTEQIEEFWKQKGYDPISHMMSRTNYSDDKIRWDRFLGSTGITPIVHNEYQTFDFAKGPKGEYVKDSLRVAHLRFLNEQPKLGDAIKTSINQANTEFAAKAFSFGRLLVKHDRRSLTPGMSPSQISPSAFLNYVSQLKYASGLSLDAAIANSVVDANVGAIGNSTMDIVSQSPALSKMFRIQPQRLVKTATLDYKNVPGFPYTVQSLEYKGGMASTQTTFYAPFPNALFSIRPQIGPGYYLRKSIKSIAPKQSAAENLGIDE